VKKHRSSRWLEENDSCEPMMGMKDKKCMPEYAMCQPAMGMKHKPKKWLPGQEMCQPMMGMKPAMCMYGNEMDGMQKTPAMCGCEAEKSPCLQGMHSMTGMHMEPMLAHAYVPMQWYEKAFSPQEAFQKGTLFPELYGPYLPPA
jgi:hypothetical protein